MGETLHSEATIREYLLGQIVDETTIERIEEQLFKDDAFCSRVELAEDGLINDYALGRLNEADAEIFRASLSQNPERRFKLELTQALKEKALARNTDKADRKPSFFTSLASWFHQPKYAGAFAVLLIAAVAAAIYLNRETRTEPLAELRSIYQESRPTETRISEFDYAPLTQLRGPAAPEDLRRFRRIENSLIEATEKSPGTETHHALGIFYLTQQKYGDAIKEFETALRAGSQNPRIHNDLGVAHFELARAEPREKKLENLGLSLESFTKATELDGDLLEALFNKSLTLQQMGMPREARDSWNLYLQKDPSSPWADEARKHLAQIDSEKTLFRDKDQVLADFIGAYRDGDQARARQIHNETKGLLNEVTVPLQLSQRLLEARRSNSEADVKESLQALTFIGDLEHTQNDDLFFAEFARFHKTVREEDVDRWWRAKKLFADAHRAVASDFEKARALFEQSRNLFEKIGNTWEAGIAESWAAQFLPDVGRIDESRQRLSSLRETAKTRKHKVLWAPATYWLAVCDYRQNEISGSNKKFRSALHIAETSGNTFEVHHAVEALALNYSQLGELDQALHFAAHLLPETSTYYQSQNQYWRNKGTLADLSRKLGLFSTALSLSRERLAIARNSWPANVRVNDSLRQMIYAATARKDFEAALQYAHESLNVAHSRQASAESSRIVADVHLLLGDIRSKTGDYTQALKDYDRALEVYSALPEVLDGIYRIHKGKLFCFQHLKQQQNFDVEMATVLALSEKYRRTIREDGSRQAFFANEQVVFDAAIENAIEAGKAQSAFSFAEESRSRSLLDVVASGKSIADVEKEFGPVARPLTLAEIQSRLPPDIEVVQYAVLTERVAIWIITHDRFTFYEQPINAEDLEKQVSAYQSAIIQKEPASEIKQAGRALHELLIPAPLAREKQLCIVPDKFLHQLAFNTLVTPDGNYLLEERPLFYAPSASLLVLATEDGRRKESLVRERVLSVGNPDFDREENPTLPNLQTAETEANTVAATYEKSLRLMSGEATKQEFLRSFTDVEVVHFAGHFVTNGHSPGNSKLLLAGGDLRASELSEFKLPRAKLVVLSACETGVERLDKSEGAIGIARTLLALGAPVVVASHWKVDSEPTKDLMIAFHRGRRFGRLTSTESLRQAQLQILKKEATSAPFYWAAFAVFGGYANY